MDRTKRLRAGSLVLGLAMALAACGADAPAESAGAPDDAAQATAPPVTSAFDGEFTSLSGTSVDLNSLEGTDVVFWFWAPW